MRFVSELSEAREIAARINACAAERRAQRHTAGGEALGLTLSSAGPGDGTVRSAVHYSPRMRLMISVAMLGGTCS